MSHTRLMLRLYRRHRVGCSHRSEAYRRCSCPIYVKGTLGGTAIRQALDQTNWDAAAKIIASWVESGRIKSIQDKAVTITMAVASFKADAGDRGLAPATLKKYKLLLDRLVDYYRQENSTLLQSVSLDTLSQFRATWPMKALAKSKTQERLKAFFTWCQVRGWVTVSPATGLSSIKVKAKPTLPFTSEECIHILDACDRYPTLNKFGHDNRARMKAMVLLLRWSGLRIQDAVTLKWDRIESGTLFLYTQKTGTPVLVPLPPECLHALEGLRRVKGDEVVQIVEEDPKGYVFWTTGNGTPESAVSVWGRSLRRLFRLAGVDHGHPHRFRDTFAVELLLKGVPIEDVSILLGHASIKVTQRHYAPWVRERQSRLSANVRAAWEGAT